MPDMPAITKKGKMKNINKEQTNRIMVSRIKR